VTLLATDPSARARAVKSPRPPFGLSAWTPDAEAAALLLDLRGADAHSAAAVAGQVPLASDLSPGAPLFVLGTAAVGDSIWQMFARGAAVPRAIRCGALLARGYVDIGAGVDEATGADLVWGSSPVA
jgi:hypothetical protein